MAKQVIFKTEEYFQESNVALYVHITDRKTALQLLETIARQCSDNDDNDSDDEFIATFLLPGDFVETEE